MAVNTPVIFFDLFCFISILLERMYESVCLLYNNEVIIRKKMYVKSVTE